MTKYSTDDSKNAFVYFYYRENMMGVSGIGFYKATCGETSKRTSLNQYIGDYDIVTGSVRFFPKTILMKSKRQKNRDSNVLSLIEY